MRIKIKYGLDSITRPINDGSTVEDLRRNTVIQMAVGYGDNVNFSRDGEVLDSDEVLHDGDVVTVENRANEKA